MKQKLILIGVLVVLISLLISWGPAAPATPTKPIEWVVHTWGPEGRTLWKDSFVWWANEVTKRTDGAMKFKFYYNEVLGPAKAQIDNIGARAFDAGPFLSLYNPGKTPSWEVFWLPLLPSWSVEAQTRAYHEMAKHPILKKEVEQDNRVKFLFDIPATATNIMSKRPIRTVGDLKGLKVRAIGAFAPALAKVNANPLTMAAPEIYESLQRGILDSVAGPSDTFFSFKIFEVCKYYSTILLNLAPSCDFAVNLNAWNELPPNIQKVMLEVADEIPAHMDAVWAKEISKQMEIYKQSGVTIIDFPPEEQKKFEEIAGKPVWNEWVKKTEAKGIPAKELLDRYLELLAKYHKQIKK